MISNENEKCLLKYISCSDKNDLLEVIYHFGINLKFKNSNPIYQIIDELNFAKYCNRIN